LLLKFRGWVNFQVRKLDFVITLVGFLSILLRWLIPPFILPNTPNDDYLGVLQANSILNGEWLGVWSNNTLSKPPLYSIFLSVAHFFPVAPTVLLHIIYLIVSFFCVKYLSMTLWSHPKFTLGFIRVAFLLLAFNPAVFANDFSRIYRTSLSAILNMLFFALIFKLVMILENQELRSTKGVRKRRFQTKITSAQLGLTYSGILLTRSEGYWVLVGGVIIISIVAFKQLRTRKQSWNVLKRYKEIGPLISLLLIFAVFSISPLNIVSTINQRVYGVSEVENFYTGKYAQAIKLWAGVDNGRSPLSFIAVSKEQRAAVYAISPTAKTMESILESPPNTGWKSFNCEQTKICDESGAWFSWELRDAAVQANGITNERHFQAFFGQLATDIQVACANRTLDCSSPGLGTGTRPLNFLPKKLLLDYSVKTLGSLVSVDQAVNVNHSDNGQDPGQLSIWKQTVNFEYLIVDDDFSNWQGLSNSLRFLTQIYRFFVPLLFLMTLFGLFVYRRNFQASEIFLVGLFAAIVSYCGGIGILNATTGFAVGLTLYGLPVQPVFMIFIIFGAAHFIANSVLKNDNSEQITKTKS
jgi:hypothetical protein